MNFDYDSEQNDLREAVRGLLARTYSDSEARRTVVKADPGFDEKTWSRLAEMGLLGLPFAEEDGGMGAGPVEVAIVAEEIGRVLAPEPFVETVVLAGGLVAAVGTPEQRGELLALELTALRVVANSAGGKPHPASSVLKLRGSELQQAATELIVDIAGPLSLASFADGGSQVPDWARVATPEYLNYRKVSIYGGSNEVQRTIIAGSILGL